MAFSNTYEVVAAVTPGAAVNVALELLAGSTKPFELVDMEIGCQSVTGSGFQIGLLLRVCSTATTGWTSPTTITPAKLNPADAAASLTAKAYNAAGTTVDGTLVDQIKRQAGWYGLGTYLYQPPAESRLIVPAANYLALKWAVAPPAGTTFTFNLTVRELG